MTETKRRFTIVLVGVTGSGKSSLGNALFGLQPKQTGGFLTSSSWSSCTLDTEIRNGFCRGDKGKPIRIIDTPGHGDGNGRDEHHREKMVRLLQAEGTVDAFVWVKNSQQPRYDKQEAEYFKILEEVFGPGLFNNLMVVFTRWPFGTHDEIRRKRENPPLTLEGVKEKLWKSMNTIGKVKMPMMAIDAMYNPSDRNEDAKFRRGVEKFYDTVTRFNAMPVREIQMVRTETERLVQQMDRLQDELKANGDNTNKAFETITKQVEELKEKLRRNQESQNPPMWMGQFVDIVMKPLVDTGIQYLGRKLLN